MISFPSIDYVMSLTPGGMKEGRENTRKLLHILGNPQDKLPVFHVTGSNGKGSVCQMISQVLWKSCGKKVGLFTSPHFIDINERFQINGIPITHTLLEKLYIEVLTLAKKHAISLSFFEIQVMVMVLYFTREKVDYAVVEVGLGGLWDGTNIFSHPLACFITSITLEHTHVLGKSRLSILQNKLGIAKPGTQLYTPLRNAYIKKNAKKLGYTVHTTSTSSILLTNLPGKHQQRNASMVLEALSHIGFNKKSIRQGLKKIDNPGRFTWISPTILVDTANNRENIKIFSHMVRKLKKHTKIITLFGTTQVEPDYAGELAGMVQADKRILIDDFCDRSLPYESYKNFTQWTDAIHFSHEKEKIENWLSEKDTTIVVYGSFYLVGEIMKLSRYKPFATV